MRLFVALWPSPRERRRLAALAPGGVRLVAEYPADLHLTLVFLGDVPSARLARLRAIIGRCVRRPMPARLGRIESWQAGQVVVAAAAAGPSLRAGQRELARRLREAGLGPGPRVFTPHVTLARAPRGAGTRGRAGPAPLLWPAVTLAGRVVALVASPQPRAPGGPRYRVLAAWPAGT